MCLIVDANVVSLVFPPSTDADFQPVWDALHSKNAVAVYGGQLAREYLQVTRLRSLFAELDREGVLRRFPDADVETKTEEIKKLGQCASDDEHIIALAFVSRVRLLCSRDQRLHADFTNPKILKPQGSVYQRKSHRHLIREHCRKRS